MNRAKTTRGGFDKVAPLYDFLSRLVFGKAMIQSQTCFLNHLEKHTSVLVLGGGTGWWLNDVLDRYPHIRITFVDTSFEMIRIARKKTRSDSRIEFIHGTLESVLPEKKFDAVVLYCFADLFEERDLYKIIDEIGQRSEEEALWIVNDFVEEKKWHSVLLKIMYYFFQSLTGLKTKSLPDWRKVFRACGLHRMEIRSFYFGFIQSALYRGRI